MQTTEILAQVHGLDEQSDTALMVLYCRSRSAYIDIMQDAVSKARLGYLETSGMCVKQAQKMLGIVKIVRERLFVRGIDVASMLPEYGG